MVSTDEGSKLGRECDEIVVDDSIKTGCGILGRYPIISILSFAVVGICIGVGLAAWDPEDTETKEIVVQWLGLVGDLFIRSLKCIILPLVFINVSVAVVDMMAVGRAGSVGKKTVLLYALTTIIASIVGIFSAMMCKGLFSEGAIEESTPATIRLGCNMEDMFITEGADGSISCAADAMTGSSEFFIADISGAFTKSSSGPDSSYSMSDTVYNGVFAKLITSNIFGSFVSGNFAAVVVFAMAFGSALSQVYFKRQARTGLKAQHISLSFLKEMEEVLMQIIYWIILVTPFAVLSLISAQVGKQDDLVNKFANVAYLVLTIILGLSLQSLIVHFGLWYFVTKSNPLGFLKFLIPAQTMAFACSSSAATLPMTLKCVKASGRVPETIYHFVLPLGATVNMDGTTIYFTVCCVWLASFNGINPNIGQYILLAIIASIGSMGSAPVPSGSLVLIITAYNTVFNTTGVPAGFEFIIPIDWFLGRMQTILNITGDAVVSGMVAHLTPDVEELAELESSNEEVEQEA